MAEESIMMNRLLVLVQIVLIPIYFIFFTINWQDEIAIFFDVLLSKATWLRGILEPGFVNFLISYGIPIIFSLPWVIISVLRATRIADAYSLMGRALGKVRIDQKLFYGLNAAFVLIFIILPFGSPLITIIAIFVAVRMFMRKILIGKFIKLAWIIPGIILAFIPTLVAIAFYINYLQLWNYIYSTWTESIGIIFGIGLSLAIAISLGNFFQFLLEGRSKYENVDTPEGLILLFKGFLLGIFLLILFGEGIDLLNYINYAAVAFAFIELGLRKLHDMPSKGASKFGIVMVIVFSLVNILTTYLKSISNFAQTLVILISGLIFFGLFYLSYKYADDPELLNR